MSMVLESTYLLPKNLPSSDFRRIRKEHIQKQINFLMIQVTKELETKFDIEVED